MTLSQIAQMIEARTFPAAAPADREILTVYAGDRISDLIEQASPHTLLVTNIANSQLIRVAELMDVPGICLVNGGHPAPELLEAAGKSGTGVIVSSAGLFETCGRLYRHLGVEGGGRQ
jgi:hypothetical protein